MRRYLIALFLVLLFTTGPVQAEILLFSPRSDLVSSDRVMDMACGRGGEIYVGTDNGLSIYNGTWRILHPNPKRRDAGLLSDTVLAVEQDSMGTLWIGYPNGLQWWNGTRFVILDDQNILKNLLINDITRWEDEMWVATGDAGIHRYANGTWTWFKPYGESGLNGYHVYRMAVDMEVGELFIAAGDNGVFVLENRTLPMRFKPLLDSDGSLLSMTGVRTDPMGGVYLFNSTNIFHFGRGKGLTEVLKITDIAPPGGEILDVAPAPDGEVFIGTDVGLFLWEEGEIGLRLGRADGIWGGRVRTLFIDHGGRCWFSTPGSVGYYFNETQWPEKISVQPPPQQNFEVPTTDAQGETPGPVLAEATGISGPVTTESSTGPLETVLASIVDFFSGLLNGN